MTGQAKKRLGELLIEAGVIDETQLKAALGHQRQWGIRLGQALVDLKLATEPDVVKVLARRFGFEVARLDQVEAYAHQQALGMVPRDFATKNNVFPLGADSSSLSVAMSDPTNLAVVDELRFRTGRKVKVSIGGDRELAEAIKAAYPSQDGGVEAIALDIDDSSGDGEPVMDAFGGGSSDAYDTFFGTDAVHAHAAPPPAAPTQPPAPAATAAAPPSPAVPPRSQAPASPIAASAAPPSPPAPAAPAAQRAAPAVPASLPRPGAGPAPAQARTATVPAMPAVPAPAAGPPPAPGRTLTAVPVPGRAPAPASRAQPAPPVAPRLAAPAAAPQARAPAAPQPVARPGGVPPAPPSAAPQPSVPEHLPSPDALRDARALRGQPASPGPAPAPSPAPLTPEEQAVLTALERLASGGHAEPEVLKPTQAIAVLVRLLLEKGIIGQRELLDALRKDRSD
jgi:hypothetical protein